ncbi:MAG: phosphatase PAP2 family protein [Lachnospiraceae bacterium]|nr:phosphatase PAP2 family protein [Lachnospiraceae bacterium]
MNTEMQILYWFQGLHNPILDKVMIVITTFGKAGIFWILLTLAMLIFSKKPKKMAWTSMVALVLSVIVVNLILKNLVCRERPCWVDETVKMLVKVPKDFSFPSGHSSASFASAVSIFLYRKKEGIAALVLATLIAVSRLYLFVHWPTDVLVGSLLGIVEAIVAYFIVRFVYDKFIDKKAKTV